MTRQRKLPAPSELAGIVNLWLVAGRPRGEIAQTWGVTWWAILKSLSRAGYTWHEARTGWFALSELSEGGHV